jgi:putative ubiquitin-RnfH superfamily antitoxin RatB of RatAB toxin-antitoxin module
MDHAEHAAGAPATLQVAVACSPGPGVAFEVAMELPAPATAADAVRASGLAERFPELCAGTPSMGIWGRAVAPEASLRDGDRVEVYRPLAVDPQEARRLRAKKARPDVRR